MLLLLVLGVPLEGHSESLDVDSVLEKAVLHSWDLKMATVDTAISKAGIKTAQAIYFPTITAQLNSEYLSDLTQRISSVASVGSFVLPSNTAFQNVAALQMNYLLCDFGVRKRQVQIAREDVKAKQFIHNGKYRQLLQDVVNSYAEALKLTRQISTFKEQLVLFKTLFQLKQRLYTAGTISRIEMGETGIETANTLSHLEELNHQWSRKLAQLSQYTGEIYSEDAVFNEMTTSSDLPEITTEELKGLPEYLAYTEEIEKKRLSLLIENRKRFFPEIYLYSNYYLFGSDTNNPVTAVNDLSNRNASVGISIRHTLFDGFKSAGEREKTRLEIEKLELEQQETLEALQQEWIQLQNDAKWAEKITTVQTVAAAQANQVQVDTQRLSEQALVAQTQLLERQIQTSKAQLEKVLSQIDQQAAQKKKTLFWKAKSS